MDEPIAGVDPASRDAIIDTILGNYEPGALMLIATHLVSDLETIFDEVLMMSNGQIILHENAEKLRAEKGMSIDHYFREAFKC